MGLLVNVVWAEDGHRLWLRYEPVADTQLLGGYRESVKKIVLPEIFQDDAIIAQELQAGLSGLLGIDETPVADKVSQNGGGRNTRHIRLYQRNGSRVGFESMRTGRLCDSFDMA